MRSTRRFASVAGTFAAAAILGVSVLTLAPSALASTPRRAGDGRLTEATATGSAPGDLTDVSRG
jgi:hypothetical protein